MKGTKYILNSDTLLNTHFHGHWYMGIHILCNICINLEYSLSMYFTYFYIIKIKSWNMEDLNRPVTGFTIVILVCLSSFWIIVPPD